MRSKGPETGPNGPFEPGQRPIQCYKCKGWGHPQHLCPPRLNFTRGDYKGESSPSTDKCGGGELNSTERDPMTSTIINKASQQAQRYHNPDTLLRLIGPANEATVVVDDQEYLALIDSGTQLTQMSLSLVKKLKLPIHALDTIIEVESTWGGRVAYLGYVEAKLKIPGIKGMDHDSLFMVVNDNPYTERVPITIGTLYIKQALKVVTPAELTKLPEAWGIANFPPITKQLAIKEPSFDLDTAKGKIKLTKTIKIGPFKTIRVPGKTTFKKHFKRLNIMLESLIEPNCNTVVPV